MEGEGGKRTRGRPRMHAVLDDIKRREPNWKTATQDRDQQRNNCESYRIVKGTRQKNKQIKIWAFTACQYKPYCYNEQFRLFCMCSFTFMHALIEFSVESISCDEVN